MPREHIVQVYEKKGKIVSVKQTTQYRNREVGFLVHDHVLAGHPGIKKTIALGI